MVLIVAREMAFCGIIRA